MLNKKLKFFTVSLTLVLSLATCVVEAKPINYSSNNTINKSNKEVSILTNLASQKVLENRSLKSNEHTKINPNKKIPSTIFNPLTATDEELKEYGFPSKPKDSKNLIKWQKIMSHAKKYTPLNVVYSNTTKGTYYNNLWSGYVAPSSSNNNIQFFQTNTEFILPSYNGSNYDDPAFWTGIGGYNGSQDIVQAGADINATGTDEKGNPIYGGTTKYQFWIEDYPENVSYITGITIKPGDTLYINVEYSNGQSYALFEDETTGYYGTISFDGKYYDGSSADAIYEATGAQYHGSWGNVNFISNTAYYNNSNRAELDSLNTDELILTTGDTVGAVPSPLGNSGLFEIDTYRIEEDLNIIYFIMFRSFF